MKSLILIFSFCIMLFGKTSAQSPKVNSGPYNLLLRTLLSHSVPEVDVQQLAHTKEKIVWVDAREKREYEVSHLPNAVWVGYDQLDLSPLTHAPKNQPIVVYCSVGYRSEKVTEKLIKQGFTNVKNLYGGIFEWKNQGGEVVNEKGKTDDVHAYNKTWGVWLTKGNKIYQ
ncbi:MAG: rhodanese-like domain-containing protein [Runella zeae]